MKGKILKVLIDSAENEKDAIDGAIAIEFSGKVYNTDAIFLEGYIPKGYIRNRRSVKKLRGKNIEFEFDFEFDSLESEHKSLDKPIKEIKIPNQPWNTTISGEIVNCDPLSKKIYLDCGDYTFELRPGNLAGSFRVGEYIRVKGLLRIRIIKILKEKNEK